MGDRRQKPKDRTKADGPTKAGRHSRNGGRNAKTNKNPRPLYANTVPDATDDKMASETKPKRQLAESCQHATACLRSYANDKVGEERRWNKPTTEKAATYMNYLFFGGSLEVQAAFAALTDDLKETIRQYFKWYVQTKKLNGTYGQKAAWFNTTKPQQLKPVLQDPAKLDPNSEEAMGIAFREKEVQLARQLIVDERLHGLPQKAAELFFSAYPYVKPEDTTRVKATNAYVWSMLTPQEQERIKAADLGMIRAKLAIEKAREQLRLEAA